MPIPPNKLYRSILTTLTYFDMFDFPLTKEEITHFLHTPFPVPAKEIENALVSVSQKRIDSQTFYFLPQREKVVRQRVERKKISDNKIRNAERIIKLLGFLPTILFIGISGSLAMKNGDMDSDIDLFIITTPQTVWITRLLVWIFLAVAFRRRKRGTKGKDTFCVNMLIARDALLFPKERQDIYTAHEIVQLRPFINKKNTYEVFLNENIWIQKFLANSVSEKMVFSESLAAGGLLLFLFRPIEHVLRNVQLWYLKRHKTIEQTTDKVIAFHPYDYRDTIVKEFERRIRKYAI